VFLELDPGVSVADAVIRVDAPDRVRYLPNVTFRVRPLFEVEPGDREIEGTLAGYREAVDDLTDRIEALAARRVALIRRLRDGSYRNSGVTPDDEGGTVNDLTRLPADLPAPQDDGAADHLAGRRVPRMELSSTAGGSVALDALGTGRSIVYFYPLTGRPDTDLPEGWNAIPGARGCTAEACGFRDHSGDLAHAGAARVFGVSSQDNVYQRELVDRLRLPFSMLSDVGLQAAKKLGLPTFTVDGMTLYRRLTLVIRDGAIEHAFYPVFPPDRHARQVLDWLRDNPVEG
jgi:peroxiredoxin